MGANYVAPTVKKVRGIAPTDLRPQGKLNSPSHFDTKLHRIVFKVLKIHCGAYVAPLGP